MQQYHEAQLQMESFEAKLAPSAFEAEDLSGILAHGRRAFAMLFRALCARSCVVW